VHRKLSYALARIDRHMESLPPAIAPVALPDFWRWPHLNRRFQAAFCCCANELIREDDLVDDRVRFRAITLATVIDAIHQVGAATLAKQRWARYCDFVRQCVVTNC
jgi:hypothetical protein